MRQADAPLVSTLGRRAWLRLLAAGCAGSALFAARAATVLDGQWLDASRARQLPWRLRLPPTLGPWPLLLYSHGLGGSRLGGSVWGEAWAQAGIAVLHLQHPGSDRVTARSGLAALRAAASGEQLLERVSDVRFALDEVERLSGSSRAQRALENPWQDLSRTAIGVAGHSFGAHTVQALAGQSLAGSGDLSDPRPRAFMALSPSMPRLSAQSVAGAKQAFGGVTRPFLAATGSNDSDPFGRFQGGASRALVFEGLPAGQKALLWLEGADHMSFGGGLEEAQGARSALLRREGRASELEPLHQSLVARISALWWRAHLLEDASARAQLALPQTLGVGDRFVLG